jgi:hypothetical protein
LIAEQIEPALSDAGYEDRLFRKPVDAEPSAPCCSASPWHRLALLVLPDGPSRAGVDDLGVVTPSYVKTEAVRGHELPLAIVSLNTSHSGGWPGVISGPL